MFAKVHAMCFLFSIWMIRINKTSCCFWGYVNLHLLYLETTAVNILLMVRPPDPWQHILYKVSGENLYIAMELTRSIIGVIFLRCDVNKFDTTERSFRPRKRTFNAIIWLAFVDCWLWKSRTYLSYMFVLLPFLFKEISLMLASGKGSVTFMCFVTCSY